MTATVQRTRRVAAPAAAVWDLLADFGRLARWVPEIDHSCVLHGGAVGVGTVRRIQLGRTAVLETVTAWSPTEHLAYDLTGLPPVLRRVANAWDLHQAGAGTDVTITTTVDAGPRPPQLLLARLVARRMGRTSDHMLAGLAAALPTGDPTCA